MPFNVVTPPIFEKEDLVKLLFAEVGDDALFEVWSSLEDVEPPAGSASPLARRSSRGSLEAAIFSPDEYLLMQAILVVIKKIKSQAIAWRSIVSQELVIGQNSLAKIPWPKFREITLQKRNSEC